MGVAALVAAGCGDSPSSPSSPRSGSTASPLAGLSGKQVLTKAVDNLKATSSFTIDGRVANAGEAIQVDLAFRPGKGCMGTVSTADKGSLTMVVIGTTAWVNPSDAYWKAVAGQQAGQAIATFGGKYLKGPTSDSTIAGLTELCDLNSLAAQLTKPSDVVKGEMTTVAGKQAHPLKEPTNGSTLYVTNSSRPLPIELVSSANGKTGAKKGVLFFHIGAPVSLAAPPASKTVDAAKYGL